MCWGRGSNLLLCIVCIVLVLPYIFRLLGLEHGSSQPCIVEAEVGHFWS